jgi:putative toxin-antitoxin system antitoxin component (TIGR02293 family)
MTNVMTIYADRLARIKTNVGLSREDVARVVGASSRTVARWASGANMPRGVTRERLLELATISQQLAKVMRPDAAAAWLFEPNPLLKNNRPVDLVAQGRFQEVLDLIDAVGEGVFV